MHEGQNPATMLITKNGSQEIMKTPITVPDLLIKDENVQNYPQTVHQFLLEGEVANLKKLKSLLFKLLMPFILGPNPGFAKLLV